MSQIYVIVADNGAPYEEHSTHNVCAFTNKADADAFAVAATAAARLDREKLRSRRERYFDGKLQRYPTAKKSAFDSSADAEDDWSYHVEPLPLYASLADEGERRPR